MLMNQTPTKSNSHSVFANLNIVMFAVLVCNEHQMVVNVVHVSQADPSFLKNVSDPQKLGTYTFIVRKIYNGFRINTKISAMRNQENIYTYCIVVSERNAPVHAVGVHL